MGKGVTVEIQDEERLIEAFRRAQKISRQVIVEKFIPGEDYRLLVINGRFIAAAHRKAAQVQSDGTSTVRDLIKAENARSDREPILSGRMASMKQIKLDRKALGVLEEQGLTLDCVPEKGQAVLLRRESNISRGGESFDVTQSVHPSVRSMAERTAAVIGLDVCGVDYITTDLSRECREVRRCNLRGEQSPRP